MAIPCAVLMCHAPIVIPAIAGARAALCAETTQGMERAARHLIAHRPDVLVIISPHTPRDRQRFGIAADDVIRGDFSAFGYAELELELPGAPAAAAALCEAAQRRGLGTWRPPARGLDHGALVPLHFMRAAGWNGPTLLLALPFPGAGGEASMGRALADAAARLGQRWCVLASGDMSHRLTLDAPAGYHPTAREFDLRFRDLIGAGELERATAIDAGLRELAAEDVVDSCTVAAAAVDFDPAGHRLLSYQGPFGVGYLAAVLHEERTLRASAEPSTASEIASEQEPPRELLQIAHAALAAHVRGSAYTPSSLAAPWARSRGVFVTLYRHGELRGCIGHLEPSCATLAQEIATCAVASATRDTRFSPLQSDELDALDVEISLLSPPEAIADQSQLDPQRYGVVVSAGARRGVLLPAIRGIETARDQVRIAASKAGLRLDTPYTLERFAVLKVKDQRPHLDAPSASSEPRGRHGYN